jgi:hypothetical protein
VKITVSVTKLTGCVAFVTQIAIIADATLGEPRHHGLSMTDDRTPTQAVSNYGLGADRSVRVGGAAQ